METPKLVSILIKDEDRFGKIYYSAVISDSRQIVDILDCQCLKTLINILKRRSDIKRENGRINYVDEHFNPISTTKMKRDLLLKKLSK